MRKAFLFFLILSMAQGCSDKGTEAPARTAYEQWKAADIHNYSIEQNRVCFCPYEGPVRITVRNDTITRIVRVSDGSEVPGPYASYYRSVNDLFGIILGNKQDSLVIEYDRQFGYPVKLDINPQDHPVDGGELILTSKLELQ